MDREKIIKALEYCTSGGSCFKCEYNKQENYSEASCMVCHMRDALALIKELAEDNEYLKTALTACEARYDSRKESDLEEVLELRLKVDELIEEKEKLCNLTDELLREKRELWEENTRLVVENERLRVSKGIAIFASPTHMAEYIKLGLAVHFGTYTENDPVKIKDVLGLIDQVAKEMLDERPANG